MTADVHVLLTADTEQQRELEYRLALNDQKHLDEQIAKFIKARNKLDASIAKLVSESKRLAEKIGRMELSEMRRKRQ